MPACNQVVVDCDAGLDTELEHNFSMTMAQFHLLAFINFPLCGID
jgi:hypothetical protein